MSVLMSVLNVLFWVGNCQSCLRNMCRIMYFQCGVGAHQQRLKLSDGRILQLEGSDAESLVSLTYSRLIQDRHGQPNMARSNGHCEGSKRLTKPSRRDCEAMVPHSASHVEPLPKAVHHYLFWGRFGMLCQ